MRWSRAMSMTSDVELAPIRPRAASALARSSVIVTLSFPIPWLPLFGSISFSGVHRSLLAWLRCPACSAALEPSSAAEDIEAGQLRCDNGHTYPIRRGVPRFVATDEYTRSFSYEWQRFRRTQLDSATGRTDTRDRLQASLNFPLDQLKGQLVLDAGCGMGRFSEIVHQYGGTYVGVDFSYAVDAAHENAGHLPNVHFVQADLFALPFADNVFDLVMSLGVLHHTPDPRRAFASLPRVLKPGGKLTVTVYDAGNKMYVANSRFWRRYT